MSALLSKELFTDVARELNILPVVLEKDWHVTQVLASLSRLDYPNFKIVFSGGTALSKAHKLTYRFSEDIDFRIIAIKETSRSILSAFKKNVVKYLRNTGFSIQEQSIKARDNNHFFSFRIEYLTHFAPVQSLRPHIQVEMAVQSPRLPVTRLPVYSFINEIMGKPPEVDGIDCLSPVENAADKLSALSWRIPTRVRDANDDPSVVRHIHDLALLEEVVSKGKDFSKLLSFAMLHDDKRAKENSSFNNLSHREKADRMLEILSQDEKYIEEYKIFVEETSYAPNGESVPNFTKALEALKRLVHLAF